MIHTDAIWEAFAPMLCAPEPGGRAAGFYDGLALISLAGQWRGDAAKMQRLNDGPHWLANTQAIADTGPRLPPALASVVGGPLG